MKSASKTRVRQNTASFRDDPSVGTSDPSGSSPKILKNSDMSNHASVPHALIMVGKGGESSSEEKEQLVVRANSKKSLASEEVHSIKSSIVSSLPHRYIQRFTGEWLGYLRVKYYRNVSYKMESLLVLLGLMPFLLLIATMLMLDRIIFQNLTVSVAFKVLLTFVGLLAQYGLTTVNQRHAELSCLIKIKHSEANARNIFEFCEGKQLNRFLGYAGMQVSNQGHSFLPV